MSATDAPFAARKALKARRYRWDSNVKCWLRELREDELDAEGLWLSRHVYDGVGAPTSNR